jgi:catechol 2,3-dioxygenase-like lactoylglutathione lyase family enzyme
MIDHVSIAVSDLHHSATLFDAALAPLGIVRLVERDTRIGYGKRYPEFWLNARPGQAPLPNDTGAHVGLRAPSRAAVDAFHAAALAHGATSEGAPGLRTYSTSVSYAAFVRDANGNRIEAVTFPRAGEDWKGEGAP